MKAETLRTLCLSVEGDFTRADHAVPFEVDCKCTVYKAADGWVMELNGARLGMNRAAFVASAITAQVNAGIRNSLSAGAGWAGSMYLSLTLSLTIDGLSSAPWCVCYDSDTFEARCPKAWEQWVGDFATERARELLEVGPEFMV